MSRYGSAKYRFSKSYGSSEYNANKVQKVIKYLDKNVPRYSPRAKKTTPSTTSTIPTTPAPPPSIEVLEEEQRRRLETLKSACSKYNLGSSKHDVDDAALVDPEIKDLKAFLLTQNLPSRPSWQNFYCSQEHKLSFCPIYKSASTFILKKFLLIAPSGKYDKTSVKHLDGQANILARKEFGYLPSSSTNFVHPSIVQGVAETSFKL